MAVLMDLHSRMIIGWSMKPTRARQLLLDALLMSVWRRNPGKEMIAHLGSGFAARKLWLDEVLQGPKLQPSMSRRGNYYDNAQMESFFSSLKKERIKLRIYQTSKEGRSDVFDYLEVLYKLSRRHSSLCHLSPMSLKEPPVEVGGWLLGNWRETGPGRSQPYLSYTHRFV